MLRTLPRPAIGIAVVALVLAAVPFAGDTRPGQDTAPGSGSVREVSALYDLGGGRYMQVSALVSDEDVEAVRFDDFVPGAQPVSDVGAAYSLWRKWPPGMLPVPLRYNPEGEPEGIDGAAAVQWAASTWNAVPGQSFQFAYGGTTDAHPENCGPLNLDSENTVTWGLPSSSSNAGTLAITCALIVADDERVDGVRKVIEADIFINPDIAWADELETPAGRWDLWSNVLHEVGHILGLNHSSICAVEPDPDAQCPRQGLPVMHADLDPHEQRRELQADDIAGVLALYGPQPVLDFHITFSALASDP